MSPPFGQRPKPAGTERSPKRKATGRPVQTTDTDNLLPVQDFTVGSRTIRVEAETGYSHEP